MTDTVENHAAPRHPGRILGGWLLVLICSLCIYDTLLYASLKKETWSQARTSALIAAENLRLKIAVGIRLGKTLERYRGLNTLLRQAAESAQLPLAALDTQGRLIVAQQDFPPDALPKPSFLSETKDVLEWEDAQSLTLFLAVRGRDNALAGHIAVSLQRAPLDAALWQAFQRQLAAQAVFILTGVLVLGWLLGMGRISQPPRTARSIRFHCMAVFLLVLTANGISALLTVSSSYTASLLQDAGRTGALLSHDLQRLVRAGVPLERMGSVDAYLANIEAAHDGAIALAILTPDGRLAAGSPLDDAQLLPEKKIFFLQDVHTLHEENAAHTSGWRLLVSLVRAPWLAYLRAAALDLLTVLAVALIFMMELFHLLTRGVPVLRAAEKVSASPAERTITLMRPLAFFMLFAMDMSISFIPLRMAELMPVGHAQHDMLLGLPISAEMGMTGLGVLLAGVWIHRQGARPSLTAGLAMIGLGYLGSMLAFSPWQFVVARALAGFGYGLALLTAQACTVKAGLLADMFAGVYAGSLCGSALGAMLAEHFGYTQVFLFSTLILLCLLPLPCLFLQKDLPLEEEKPASRIDVRQIAALLTDRRFLAFTLLSLIPSAMLCVGFLNYLLPIYLKDTGAAQSDIGRVYMLNCLLVIYSGPLLTRLVVRAASLTAMVCVAGLVSALGLLALAILPPLTASVLGAVFIGLATGLNIPAQSEYLLRLERAQAIGVSQSMSLLDALQRIGQILGPLAAGTLLTFMSLENAAWMVCFIMSGISLLFLPMGRLPKKPAAEGL